LHGDIGKGGVGMLIVGMVARSPKPGMLPKAELTPPIAELRRLWRVLAAFARELAMSSNAFPHIG